MLKVHVLDQLHHHRSNVAHGVEVPAGARLLFTNGQVGTKPDGSTPEVTAEQVEVIFDRLKAVLKAAAMTLNDIVRFDVYVTDRADIDPFAECATGSWAITSRGRRSLSSTGWPVRN